MNQEAALSTLEQLGDRPDDTAPRVLIRPGGLSIGVSLSGGTLQLVRVWRPALPDGDRVILDYLDVFNTDGPDVVNRLRAQGHDVHEGNPDVVLIDGTAALEFDPRDADSRRHVHVVSVR